MSCFHPLRAVSYGVKEDGKKILRIVPYDAMVDTRPDGSVRDSFPIPCGHCVGCRNDQAKMWSNRLLMESLYHSENWFLTLTYDNEHAHFVDYTNPRTGQFFPADTMHQATLDKSDVQKFMKRLRKFYSEQKIRFYAAGEYGGQTFRPHYHLVLFGLSLNAGDFVPFGKSETGDEYFVHPDIQHIWNQGFTSIEPANEYTMKYVANYVTKKIGVKPNQWYLDQGIEPPFSLMSRKPGIGAQYLEDHPDLVATDHIVIGTPRGMFEFGSPRYFRQKWREDNPEDYDRQVEVMARISKSRIETIENVTGLSYTEYCKNQETIAIAKLKQRDKV